MSNRRDDLQGGLRPPTGRGRETRRDVILAFALVLLWLCDFYFDVRHRDGFTWMDPEQYYEFARGLADGTANPLGFAVPSLFPFFAAPFLAISATIPMAFCLNAVAMLVLVGSLVLLRREIGLSTPSVVIAGLTLSSPLLTGLSRELYVEFLLTALAGMNLWLALRLLRRCTWARAAAFGALFVLGFLTKMTFPLFAALPLGGAIISRFFAGRRRDSLFLLLSVVGSLIVAMTAARFIFPAAIGYYRSLGNTAIPVMHLIGPGTWEPWGASFYYLGELFRNQLWLLTPFLLLAIFILRPRQLNWRWAWLDGEKAALWLAAVGPLLLLGLSPVREPRHVAPATVPAVLLIVLAIEAIPIATWRRTALVAASLAAVIQYAAVTMGHRATPYFVDQPFHHQEIFSALPAPLDASLTADLPPALRVLQWKFNRNLVITGFPPNEALALNWQAFPGVVYDLATVRDSAGVAGDVPYRSFEDLFLLTAFNTYNRRCGVTSSYESLSRREVLANAEFIIARVDPRQSLFPSFAGHALVRTLDYPGEKILIFQTEQPIEPYRRLYADRYLDLHPGVAPAEQSALAYNLMMVDVLRGDFPAADEVVRRFPVLAKQPRNIYWIGGYEPLLVQAQRLFQQHRSLRTHRTMP